MAEMQVPGNAEKILFVEDLVNCVVRRHISAVGLPCTAEPFRKYVESRFNDATELAILSIYSEIARNCCDGITEANDESYAIFASQIKRQYFPNGFDANNFFHYCVHMSIVAAEFRRRGYLEASRRAVFHILSSLDDFDVDNGGWETLNKFAENYTNNRRTINEDLKRALIDLI